MPTQGKIVVTNRKEALACQDIAAENSTLPYRAPELVDVASNCTLTTKADIWVRDPRMWQKLRPVADPRHLILYQSLGCILFTMAYFETPFELMTAKGIFATLPPATRMSGGTWINYVQLVDRCWLLVSGCWLIIEG